MWFIALIFIFTVSVFAENPVEFIVPTDYWPPFRIETEDGIDGIDIAIIERLSHDMGVSLIVRRMPWVRALYEMEHGYADLMSGVAYTEDRARYLRYSKEPYYGCSPAFFSSAGLNIDVDTYDDLYGKRIGYVKGSAYFEPFNSDTALNKVSLATEHQMLQMTIAERVDLIIGTDCQVLYEIDKYGYGEKIKQHSYKPEASIDLYFVVSKHSPLIERLDEINHYLSRMREDGVIDSIGRAYGEKR